MVTHPFLSTDYSTVLPFILMKKIAERNVLLEKIIFDFELSKSLEL